VRHLCFLGHPLFEEKVANFSLVMEFRLWGGCYARHFGIPFCLICIENFHRLVCILIFKTDPLTKAFS